MTWTTRPIELGDKSVAIAIEPYLAFQGLGAADDLGKLLGDRRLTSAVVLKRVAVDHVAGVLRRVLHRHHLGAEERSDRLQRRAIDLDLNEERNEPVEQDLLVRLVDVIGRRLRRSLVALHERG